MSEKPERLLLNYLSQFTKDPVLKCKQFEIFSLDIRNNILSFHSVQKSFCCDQRKRSVVSKGIILTFKIPPRLPFFLFFYFPKPSSVRMKNNIDLNPYYWGNSVWKAVLKSSWLHALEFLYLKFKHFEIHFKKSLFQYHGQNHCISL